MPDRIWPVRAQDWGYLALLALIPTGIGHSLYNYVLKSLPAYVVATAVTGEPIGASLLAYWWLGEVPPDRTILCAPFIFMGILLVSRAHGRAPGGSQSDN